MRWEGPAVYRTKIQVDSPDTWLVFHGVSYQARVFIDDVLAIEHSGIWDAFSVPLPSSESGYVDVRVEVVKNGGASFPVKDVLSGFLPYVYHTFGGIFREVEVLDYDPFGPRRDAGPPESRISVEGTKLFIDGKPWSMRGVLSWGWYPELGHPNPSPDEIRDEARKVKALGFNLVKFCLWLPPHSYFQVLEEEDMWAWVELPLWLPSENMDLEEAFAECERIVRQYRHHDRIVCWTCGCELSTSTPHEFRKRLFEMVTDLTGCPLVKDNSGGSEMYGGDLREYGTFYDFHPYCDTQFYPVVLESLQIGPRKKMPILLGEFNDYDVYRPLEPLRGKETIESHPEFPWVIQTNESDKPYWVSSDPRLNDKGVRWQHDLPGVLADPWVVAVKRQEKKLVEASRAKAGWIREEVTKLVAACGDFAGYVVTGIAPTPISTSQVTRGPHATCDPLDGIFTADQTFLIPYRQPPWTHGGNRPGWKSRHCFFKDANTLKIGARMERGYRGPMEAWWYQGEEWTEGAGEVFEVDIPANIPTEVAELTIDSARTDGRPTLWITIGERQWLYSLEFFSKFKWAGRFDWTVVDQEARIGGSRVGGVAATVRFGAPDKSGVQVCFLENGGTIPLPFWRECITFSTSSRLFRDDFDFMYDVSTDCAIDPAWLESELPGAEWILTRVDTRTYARHPYVARKGNTVVTTLRPWGGLGAQPYGLDNNPAGCELLRILMKLAQGKPPMSIGDFLKSPR